MSTAVDMFLNQIVLVGGIPFSVTVPKPPVDIDAAHMTEAQLHAKFQQGYDDYKTSLEKWSFYLPAFNRTKLIRQIVKTIIKILYFCL